MPSSKASYDILLFPNAHHWGCGDDQDNHEPCHESHHDEQHCIVFFYRLFVCRLQKSLPWVNVCLFILYYLFKMKKALVRTMPLRPYCCRMTPYSSYTLCEFRILPTESEFRAVPFGYTKYASRRVIVFLGKQIKWWYNSMVAYNILLQYTSHISAWSYLVVLLVSGDTLTMCTIAFVAPTRALKNISHLIILLK